MIRGTKKEESLSMQMKRRATKTLKEKKKKDGNFSTIISTGSTLLDLAISGGIIKGGGIPGGILVEIFGPSGTGKTVLLTEIAGDVQRKNGEIMFHDPEARLNKQFAKIFDLDTDSINYSTPDTVTEVFKEVREWEPSNKKVNGIFTDSLAALSTTSEMEKAEGDKMGMRRAKEFSEELRKTCRILTKKNLLMVCSNQVRINIDAGPYGQKYTTPGGESIGFYASLRLRTAKPEKIKEKIKVAGKEITRVIGVETQIEVFKSSIDKPYRTAPVIILFDYGIDDIRANLQYIKDYTKNTQYCVGEQTLSNSMDEAITLVEEQGLENALKAEVIALWEMIENKFDTERKPKNR
jgi:recombination protein RecA